MALSPEVCGLPRGFVWRWADKQSGPVELTVMPCLAGLATILEGMHRLGEDQGQIRRQVASVQADVTALGGRRRASETPAQLGKSAVTAARELGIRNEWAADDRGPTLSAADCAHVKSLRPEKAVTKFLAPVLRRAMAPLQPRLALVNSEEHKCLGHVGTASANETKPDLIAAHKSAVIPKGAPSADGGLADADGVVEGAIASIDSLASFVWLLSKVKDGYSAGMHECVGDLYGYVERLFEHLDEDVCSAWTLGMDGKGWKLILWAKGLRPSIARWAFAEWKQPGFASTLSRMLKDTRYARDTERLDQLLDLLGVELPPFVKDTCAFRGAGAHGRVFAVVAGGAGAAGTQQALKVALGPEHVAFLEKEMRWHQQPADKLPDPDMFIRAARFEMLEDGTGAALLFERVGNPLMASSRKKLRKKDITKALALLHKLHASGFMHGDPRAHNFVMLDDSLKLVDLAESYSFHDQGAQWKHGQREVWCFVASLLGVSARPISARGDLERVDAVVVQSLSATVEKWQTDEGQLGEALWVHYQ